MTIATFVQEALSWNIAEYASSTNGERWLNTRYCARMGEAPNGG